MTRPKGKLFALLAIFAAIGIVTATGAFTSVQAERTVDATVDSDQSALVGLVPHTSANGYDDTVVGSSVTNSSGYAQIENGVLTINLGGYDGGVAQGQSLNYNATTEFDFVFNVSNNGAQDFTYYITRNGEHANADNAVIFKQGTASGGTNVTGSANSGVRTLSPGQTDQISITVDLQGVDSSDVSAGTSLLDSITIHANSV